MSETKTTGVNSADNPSSPFAARTLDTIDNDDLSLCSLASNQVTLAAGTYICRAAAPTITSGSTALTKLRLYNATDSATVLVGQAAQVGPPSAGGMCNALLEGEFNIAASKALEVQQYASTSCNGGVNVGDSASLAEVYTVVEFWKIG